MTEQPDLKARVEELERECADLTKALTGLTRGGSEYFNRKGDRFVADIPFCVAEIRERFQRDGQRAINALHDKKAAESRLALADRLAEAARPLKALYDQILADHGPGWLPDEAGCMRASLSYPVAKMPVRWGDFRALSAALTAYEENTSSKDLTTGEDDA